MRKWIDQSTFDELLLANAEDNIERAIQGASAVLEAVQEFVPEAALFYRVTHAADSLKNYFEEASAGFRRNGILFLVRKHTYPKSYYDLCAKRVLWTIAAAHSTISSRFPTTNLYLNPDRLQL